MNQSNLTLLIPASLSGSHSKREPPDPISNSEVKPLSADDSVGLSSCESRSLPGFYLKPPMKNHRGFFFLFDIDNFVTYHFYMSRSSFPAIAPDSCPNTSMYKTHGLHDISTSLRKTARLLLQKPRFTSGTFLFYGGNGNGL
jgi:hypothetical protein